jgi:hypothetical protein
MTIEEKNGMNSDREREREGGREDEKTVVVGRTCCCLSEPSWRAVTSNAVFYVNKRHRISNKSGRVHSNSGSTDRDSASDHDVSRNGRRPPRHQHDSRTWII